MAFDVAQGGKFLPRFPAVYRFKERGVFCAAVNRVGIRVRGFKVPDAFELPWVLRAVIPLVRSNLALVSELVALPLWHAIGTWRRAAARNLPGLSTVVRALNDLSEPAACLRRVDAVRFGRRTLEVIHLPAREVRPVHLPVLTLAIGRQHEGPLFRSNQYANFAHCF